MSSSSTKDKILQQLAENSVIIYMKGVPTAPECGFSAKAVGILNATGIPFAYVDVLKAPFIREKLPSISKWPPFPQIFVNGELVGGADIIEAMDQDGSLLPLLESAEQQKTEHCGSLSPSEVEKLILGAFPDAVIEIDGQGCDLAIKVTSSQFEGLSMVQQHQAVMATLTEVLASGRLHAVTLKTHIPVAKQETPAEVASALFQIQI